MNFKTRVLYHILKEWAAYELSHSTLGLQLLLNRRRKKFLKNLRYSKFYRKFNSFEDLPLGSKELLMDHFAQINTAGLPPDLCFQVGFEAEKGLRSTSEINNITVGLSSGTSGNRGIFLVSERERAQWVATVLVRVIGLRFQKRKVAFFLRANSELYESVKSTLLSFTYYNIFHPTANLWQQLEAQQPHIIVAQPSVLLNLIKAANTPACPWPVQQVISVAEVLTQQDQTQIASWFQTRVDQVYQCTEGFLAHTCPRGQLHWNGDFIFLEKAHLNDSKYQPIITDFKRSTQPIVRYKMNDILEMGQCECGLKTEVIASIDGRSDDIFSFQDADFYPDFIRRTVIFSSSDIQEYSVTKKNNEVELYIQGPHEAQAAAFSALQSLFASKGVHPNIRLVSTPYIAANGKKKRVVNLD